MAETKHTPGPWTADRQYIEKKMPPGSNRKIIAEVYWHVYDEYEANARLIAAAPELLEALELLVSFACSRCDWTACSGSQYVEHCPHVENAKQLIAKAKGKPNP